MRRNRIANLLMKGKLPRGHGNAVKPHVEPGVGQVGMKPADKRLIVIPCIGQKHGSHGACFRQQLQATEAAGADSLTPQPMKRNKR